MVPAREYWHKQKPGGKWAYLSTGGCYALKYGADSRTWDVYYTRTGERVGNGRSLSYARDIAYNHACKQPLKGDI